MFRHAPRQAFTGWDPPDGGRYANASATAARAFEASVANRGEWP